MKALSIMQPWAWLIVNGHKPIENRNWQPNNPGLKFRGEFLIHTGQKADGNACELDTMRFIRDLIAPAELPWGKNFHFGGIVGMAEIVDVVTHHDSPWFFGPIGLVIRNARPLPFMPVRGQLGFFNVDYRRPDEVG